MAELRLLGENRHFSKKSVFEPILLKKEIFRPPDWTASRSAGVCLADNQHLFLECWGQANACTLRKEVGFFSLQGDTLSNEVAENIFLKHD